MERYISQIKHKTENYEHPKYQINLEKNNNKNFNIEEILNLVFLKISENLANGEYNRIDSGTIFAFVKGNEKEARFSFLNQLKNKLELKPEIGRCKIWDNGNGFISTKN